MKNKTKKKDGKMNKLHEIVTEVPYGLLIVQQSVHETINHAMIDTMSAVHSGVK